MKQNDRYYTSSYQAKTAKTNVKDNNAPIYEKKESWRDIYEIESRDKLNSYMKSLIGEDIFESSLPNSNIDKISLPDHLSISNNPKKTLNSNESNSPRGLLIKKFTETKDFKAPEARNILSVRKEFSVEKQEMKVLPINIKAGKLIYPFDDTYKNYSFTRDSKQDEQNEGIVKLDELKDRRMISESHIFYKYYLQNQYLNEQYENDDCTDNIDRCRFTNELAELSSTKVGNCFNHSLANLSFTTTHDHWVYKYHATAKQMEKHKQKQINFKSNKTKSNTKNQVYLNPDLLVFPSPRVIKN